MHPAVHRPPLHQRRALRQLQDPAHNHVDRRHVLHLSRVHHHLFARLQPLRDREQHLAQHAVVALEKRPSIQDQSHHLLPRQRLEHLVLLVLPERLHQLIHVHPGPLRIELVVHARIGVDQGELLPVEGGHAVVSCGEELRALVLSPHRTLDVGSRDPDQFVQPLLEHLERPEQKRAPVLVRRLERVLAQTSIHPDVLFVRCADLVPQALEGSQQLRHRSFRIRAQLLVTHLRHTMNCRLSPLRPGDALRHALEHCIPAVAGH
mmetsp:Transcript_29222/g.70044  ORF Transcript_29222/g.70044 Transcript_29222/m.70044 type:complete len:263 (-) Transcript_29222:327-1115(-)